MNRAPNSIASTAFRGGVLYVQVSTPESILGNIYAINDPNANRGGRGGTSGISNTLYYTLQTIHGLHNFTVSGNQNLVSMVSGTTIGNSIPNGVRHDIFLAFTPSGALTAPVLVRLQPSSTGPVSVSNTDWVLYQDEGGIQSSVLAPTTSSMAQIASGQIDLSSTPYSASVEAEGSAIYEIYWNSLSTGEFQLQKVDVSTLGTPSDPTSSPAINVLWIQTFSLLDSTSSPKLLRLSDGGYFDVVVIGKCAGSSQTCLVFFNDSNNPSVVVTNLQFSSANCFAAVGNSMIVMVSSSETWVYNYSNIFGGTLSTSWNKYPNMGSAPASIVACNANDQTFYAIQGVDDSGPQVATLDLGSSSPPWTWQTANMVDTSSCTHSSGGGGSDDSCSIGSNNGSQQSHSRFPIIYPIIAAVVVVIAACVFLFYRKRKLNPFTSSGKRGTVTTIVSPAPLNHNNNNNNNNGNIVSPTLGAIPLHTITTSQSGGDGTTNTLRAHSWSTGIPTSNAAPSAAVAMYTNRSSLPLHLQQQPTTNISQANSIPPLQQSNPVASSPVAAPYRPFVISPSPAPSSASEISTPLMRNGRSSITPGDKRELEDDAEDGSINSSRVDGRRESGSSSLSRSNPLYPSPEEEAQRAQARNTSTRPFQDVLSPTLANAQLILQQSQQPRQY